MRIEHSAISVLVCAFMVGCNLPGGNPFSTPLPGDEVEELETGPSLIAPIQEMLPETPRFIYPPPITPLPRSTETIYGIVYSVYQSPGDSFRIVCQDPCGMDERLIYAIYAGFKVYKERLVRVAGIDVIPEMIPVDIHPVTDTVCDRPGGEIGSAGPYDPLNYDSFICLYIDQVGDSDPGNPPTPETAIRIGGLGVIGHEYSHALLFHRHRGSLEDYVQVLSFASLTGSLDLCSEDTRTFAPLVYNFCQQNGLTLETFRTSLIELDRLYRGGFGIPIEAGSSDGRTMTFHPTGFNQYRAVLQNILGSDPQPAFMDAGWNFDTDYYEPNIPYILPWTGESCTYRAELQEDVSIPEGTTLDNGTPFEKTWRVLNSGTCPWEGVSLAFSSGEAMTDDVSVDVPPTAAGTSVEISVGMTAPMEAGVHVSQWYLHNATGEQFGPVINMVVYTRPGCSFPPEISGFSVSPQVIGRGALAQLSWTQVTNADQVSITPGIGQVDPNFGSVLVDVSETTAFTMTATCAGNTSEKQVTLTVDNSLPEFEVTNLYLFTTPQDYAGPCASTGQEIDISSEITVSSPGAVVFQWEYDTGSSTSPMVLVFGNAGTLAAHNFTWRSSSFSELLRFILLAPVSMQAETTFSQTCIP